MSEFRELRVYMLSVGIVACVLRIAMVLAEHINFGGYWRCAENAWLDPALRSWNCWW